MAKLPMGVSLRISLSGRSIGVLIITTNPITNKAPLLGEGLLKNGNRLEAAANLPRSQSELDWDRFEII
jgi:hypothetical protein